MAVWLGFLPFLPFWLLKFRHFLALPLLEHPHCAKTYWFSNSGNTATVCAEVLETISWNRREKYEYRCKRKIEENLAQVVNIKSSSTASKHDFTFFLLLSRLGRAMTNLCVCLAPITRHRIRLEVLERHSTPNCKCQRSFMLRLFFSKRERNSITSQRQGNRHHQS